MNEEFALIVDGWFDGATRRPEVTTVHVQNGVIRQIAAGDHGREFALRAVAIERGSFLMPGLVDAHVHLHLDGAPTDAATRAAHQKKPVDELLEAARQGARQSLAHGVTLVREAGDRYGINHRLRSEAVDGDGLPHVRSTGIGIRRPKRYGAFFAREVSNDEEIRTTVAELACDSDEIKLVLTGIIDFEAGAVTDEPQFDLEATRLVVESARAAGRRTMVHCSGAKGLDIAARAGVGSIEHGFFMSRETLSIMRDNDVAWTPTFCPVHFQWAHPQAVGWSAGTVANLRRILDQHAEHLRMADELGVRLLLGTDAGSMGVEHGVAVLEEIRRFLEAGLSLERTLRAATSAARRHFGARHSLLAQGAPFEALLLDRSPFDDLRALITPTHTYLNAV